ncbi:MAG: aspartate dehydrogenase domain-containing protein [Endomicrobiia bacterium]
MKNLGIIGCGNVATEILKSNLQNVSKIFLYDIDNEKSYILAEMFSEHEIVVCTSIKEVIKKSDLIVESASVNAVGEILFEIKSFLKKELLILSVGGLIKNFRLYKDLISKNYKIYIPSGAIAGCDALTALKGVNIKSITLKTTKPAETLLSVPYVKSRIKLYKKILLNKITKVFQGNVYDAIKYFPQNINVAATLAIISGQPQKVEVELVAQKGLTKNIHEITIISVAGKIYTRTENVPSVSNPKTSYLAALSVISNLRTLLGR